MKRCSKCDQDKPTSEFYSHSRDGLRSDCKVCCNEYRQSEKYRATQKRYVQSEKGRVTLARTRKRVRSTDIGKAQRRVHKAVACALKSGRLIQGRCEASGLGKCSGGIQAHHWSYDKKSRLDIFWLCRGHHRQEHTRIEDLGYPHNRVLYILNIRSQTETSLQVGDQ